MYNKIIFDTNILLYNPDIISNFKENIIITKTIFHELDYRKKDQKYSKIASRAINLIEKNNIKLTGKDFISKNKSNDEIIILEALHNYDASSLLMVSNDTGMRVLAKNKSISSKNLQNFFEDIENDKYSLTKEKSILYELLKKNKFEECSNILNLNPNLNFNFYLDNGNTPLIECIQKNKRKEIDFIIHHKSSNLDLFDKSKLKMPAFLHASQRRKIEIMKQLLEFGANPHLTVQGKNKGNSALLIAAFDNAFDVIKFLLENKNLEISINQSDSNGFTALIKATFKGYEKLVKYLISKGADPFIRDREHKSALDHVKEHNYNNIYKLISEYINICTEGK